MCKSIVCFCFLPNGEVDVRLGPELRSYALRSVGAWIDVYDCGMELLDMGLCILAALASLCHPTKDSSFESAGWIRDDPDEGSQAEELAVAKVRHAMCQWVCIQNRGSNLGAIHGKKVPPD